MKYNYLMLDFDGTLINSEAAQLNVAGQLHRLLLGREMTQSDMHDAMAKPTEEIYGSNPETMALMMRLYDQYQRQYGVPLFDGVLDVIGQLKEAGAVLCAVTARRLEEVQRDESIRPLMPFFDYIMACDVTPRPKPAPDPVEHFIQKTGAAPCEVLLLGDTYADCMCAKSAGVDFALATWGALDKTLEAKYYPADIWEFKKIVMGQDAF